LPESSSAFSESERAIPSGVTRLEKEKELSSPFVHPLQRLVFKIKGFECSAPLVVSSLVEPASHRPLQEVDLGFQSEVPGDLPLPPRPVLQAYLILRAGRYRRPWVETRATLEG